MHEEDLIKEIEKNSEDMLSPKQVLEWLVSCRSEQNYRKLSREIRGSLKASSKLQRYISQSAKMGKLFETLPHRIGITNDDFETLIERSPQLFNAHIAGMQFRIEELNEMFQKFLSENTGRDEEHPIIPKQIDHWKRTISSMISDMNALINKYCDRVKSVKDILEEGEDIFG